MGIADIGYYPLWTINEWRAGKVELRPVVIDAEIKRLRDQLEALKPQLKAPRAQARWQAKAAASVQKRIDLLETRRKQVIRALGRDFYRVYGGSLKFSVVSASLQE